MLKLFGNKRKKKQKLNTNDTVDNNKVKINDKLEIDGVSVSSFKSHPSFVNEDQLEEILTMALYVCNEYKRDKSSINDLIQLLHPNNQNARLTKLRYLYNRREQMIQDLHELQFQIKRNNNEKLKEQFRQLQKQLKMDIEKNIKTLEKYHEMFKKDHVKEQTLKKFDALFLYLDEMFYKKFGNKSMLVS